MGGGLVPSTGVIRAITRQLEIANKRTKLSDRAISVINARYEDDERLEADKKYDLVYILKEDDNNPDLKMSLRSIERFCTYRNVWVIGYKPSWLQNVNYIHTEQLGNKWKNSCLNWKTACECKDISDDFIIMNDDFIAIRPIHDWKNSLNVYLGYVSDEAQRWKRKQKISRWQNGFIYAQELLDKCKISTEYNYEAHLPMIINKEKYLKFINIKPIKNFMEESKVLHKRTLYKNMFPEQDISSPHKIKDVKINLGYDFTDSYLKENWISVFDDVIDNVIKFPKINMFLHRMFSEKSNFEK